MPSSEIDVPDVFDSLRGVGVVGVNIHMGAYPAVWARRADGGMFRAQDTLGPERDLLEALAEALDIRPTLVGLPDEDFPDNADALFGDII